MCESPVPLRQTERLTVNSGIEQFNPQVDYSVLVSCYFEEQSIDEFYQRLSETMKQLGRSYEIIFVNDGSTDRTFEKLKRIFPQDPNVTAVIDFFKNAGQANAKTPAVMLARGKGLLMIDSDLQLDPEDIPLLTEKFEEGFDIVSGYRKNRQDVVSRKLPSILANYIMRKASNSKILDFGCTFKIYDARLVKGFGFDNFKPWRPLPVISQAQNIAEVPVNHHARKYGQSGWTFRKLFAYNMESVVNLSQMPFQVLAALCAALSLLFVLRLALITVFDFSILNTVTNGLILNAIGVCFLALFAVLCMIGEFVLRNFGVLQRKPAFIIKEILTKKAHTRVSGP
jgi:glycosyltransferase involved in cell wall biosynthesis